MAETLDIRWQQRFSNYRKALDQLSAVTELCRQRELSDLEQQGLIKAFEFTYELAWNVMKDYFDYQGATGITGSRDAFRESFKRELIQDGEGWMDMIVSRNKSSHTYNQETADEIADKVVTEYYPLFAAFAERMQELIDAGR